ncbi:MAG TPA: uracil-DNA glycosylase [Terriglobales bacterium]|nr:uracil-DNA glycosylase [Terriglobales bacterium]
MTTLCSRLERNWRDIISCEFDRSKVEKLDNCLQRLERFLQSEKAAGHKIYPDDTEIFNALNSTAFKNIKVVIIGQDPYHGEGQAHGLCLSVPTGVDIPRSLRNIYKEIDPSKMPSDGDLTAWAKQGVLLLNATLTVREAEPRSHEGQGWEEFTDAIIRAVNKKREPVVFLLWGSDAQKKRALIGEKHLVLEASHPSPRSAYRGRRPFVGCGHFKEANIYLIKHGLKPVVWQKI